MGARARALRARPCPYSEIGRDRPGFPAGADARLTRDCRALVAAATSMPTAGPFLLARGRIQAALRRWFEARGFVEVEPASCRSRPATRRTCTPSRPSSWRATARRRAALSAHLAGIRLQEAAGGRASRASSPSPTCSATASAGACTIPSSPCSNGIARRALRGADGGLRRAAGRGRGRRRARRS